MQVLSCCGILVVLAAVGLGYLIGTSPPNAQVEAIPDDSLLQKVPSWPAFRFASGIMDFFSEGSYLVPPQLHVHQIATAYWKSEVAYTLTYHGIIDAVHDGSPAAGCIEVAFRLGGGLNQDVLCRYMRAGVGIGLLGWRASPQGSKEEGLTSMRFHLTPAGNLLRKGVPGSLRDYVLYINEESRDAYRAAGIHSMTSGRSGFMEAFGEEHFEWYAQRSSKQKLFDDSMTAMTPVQAGPLLADWSPPSPNATVCDIGGGQGHLLAVILQHYPSLKGLLVDQPTVVNRSLAYLASQNVGDRAAVIGASILEPLPSALAACDAFVLKMILHDWSDEQGAEILRNIARVAHPGARLDLVEHVLLEGSFLLRRFVVLLDIHMQANHAARERTLPEFRELVRKAGITSAVQPVRLRGTVMLLQMGL
mmetsp:Transcript_64845/g.163363  ORF Transcript_64845/g.163363 Transcript_64845/m.163363 type:complete len:420 (-) Transcript_64845:211-1470(-)